MSSRLPTSAVQAVGLLVDRVEELAPRLRRPLDVVLEQARDGRLDRGDRRAQVVRDGGEDRRAQLVRRRHGAGGLDRQPRARRAPPRRRAPSRRRRAHALLAPQRRDRARASTCASSRSSVARGGLRALGRAVAAGRVDPPAGRPRGGARRPRRARARGVRLSSTAETGAEPASRRERLGLGARARSLGRAAGGEGDEAADDRGDGEEDDEGEDVLALADREGVERRREVPVDEQEAADRCGERRPEAADGGDADDEQQEEQEDARQPDLVAEPGEHARPAPAGRRRRAPRPISTRRRGSAAGRRRWGSAS